MYLANAENYFKVMRKSVSKEGYPFNFKKE